MSIQRVRFSMEITIGGRTSDVWTMFDGLDEIVKTEHGVRIYTPNEIHFMSWKYVEECE